MAFSPLSDVSPTSPFMKHYRNVNFIICKRMNSVIITMLDTKARDDVLKIIQEAFSINVDGDIIYGVFFRWTFMQQLLNAKSQWKKFSLFVQLFLQFRDEIALFFHIFAFFVQRVGELLASAVSLRNGKFSLLLWRERKKKKIPWIWKYSNTFRVRGRLDGFVQLIAAIIHNAEQWFEQERSSLSCSSN